MKYLEIARAMMAKFAAEDEARREKLDTGGACQCPLCSPEEWQGFPEADIETWPAKWKRLYADGVQVRVNAGIPREQAEMLSYRQCQDWMREERRR